MLRLSSVFLLATVASCGLVNPNVTDFALKFPESDFTIDTADWNIQGSGNVPSVPCSLDCGAAASQICGSGSGCSADCETTTQTCQAHITESLVKMYNLATQAPEYQTIADQPVAKVTIDNIWFQINDGNNTLNVDTPPFQVFMAPETVMDPSDPSAKLVGTVNSVPAGFTGKGTLTFAQGGKANMEAFMDDFHTPFNVIVSGIVDVKGGEPTPMGKLIGFVSADAHAGI
jgi:hypothetical protein